MSIVVITILGEAQRTFVNSLHKMTREGIDLVIIQRPKPNHLSFFLRIKKLYKNVGLIGLPEQIFYALLLRFRKSARKALEYFREHTNNHESGEAGYLAKTLAVDSINSEEVFQILQKISPRLLVIWGNTIVKPHIIKTARKAINLHMGLCPYYHGAIANQYAVISGRPQHIGATIHYAVDEVDAGDILNTITVNLSLPPKQLFLELNDKAKERYLEIAYRLFSGEDLPSKPQDLSKSENFKLKNWTPKTRYNLAKQILEWERSGGLYKSLIIDYNTGM